MNLLSITSLFPMAHSSKTSRSRLSKFLLRFLFSDFIDILYLYMYELLLFLFLFLFTDDQYGGFFVYKNGIMGDGFYDFY